MSKAIKTIKAKLVRKETKFLTGGFKPTNAINESWIGRVYLYKEDEEIPTDKNGELMIPLAQLCLDDLPFIPTALQQSKVLTIFISKELPMDLIENGEGWLIREYRKTDTLVVKDLVNKNSILKAFPLKPQMLDEDYPVWDGGGIPEELEEKILELEDDGEIESYQDVAPNVDGHKIGGYPSFHQSGIDFGENFEFLVQIDSDEKIKLNIVDGGSIYLAKHAVTNAWRYYCDFH